VLERDFVFTPSAELSVWDAAHPKPDAAAGRAHELAMLKHWATDSDATMAPLLTPKDATAAQQAREVIGSAWDMIVDRRVPGAGDVTIEATKTEHDGYISAKGQLRHSPTGEEVSVTFMGPKVDRWNGTAVVWLSPGGVDDVGGVDAPNETVKQLLATGAALALPELYLPGAETSPRLMPKPQNLKEGEKPDMNGWQHSACYTYGYNPSLLAQRVRDAITTLAMVKNHPQMPAKRIVLVASGGYGAIGAAAAAAARDILDAVVIDTQGFRFASLTDQYATMFVPGAVKYGDLPGLLTQVAPCSLTVIGESSLPGVEATYKALGGTFAMKANLGESLVLQVK
jgi:hypothetical protein